MIIFVHRPLPLFLHYYSFYPFHLYFNVLIQSHTKEKTPQK